MSSPSPVSRPNAQSPLAQWLAYLESIHARPIDMGLERVRAVADRLGHDTMQARYGGSLDVLVRPHRVMASLDRWAATAVRGAGGVQGGETAGGRR